VPGPARPRPQLGGFAAAARELVGSGAPTERESCGIVYSIAVSAVATATTITLPTGLRSSTTCGPA
jgi:hypothetical protein